MAQCLLCQNLQCVLYYREPKRDYYQCQHCHLVFVPETWHISHCQEKNEYDKHQNDVHDQGYRQFLSRLSLPLTKQLEQGGKILDFGCGDGPALMTMLKEQGFDVEGFDIYYKNTPEVLSKFYHAICLTEVIEHLSQPMPILQSLCQQLLPAGILAIMTKTVINKERFSRWHYKNDPTHIAFYSDACFHYLAKQLGLRFLAIDNDVFFFVKP